MVIVLTEFWGYTLLIGTIMCIVFFALFMITIMLSPALTFVRARLGGKGILWNPRTNRQAPFLIIKKQIGKLAKTKEGFFVTKPEDFYTACGTPMATVYSNYAITINPKIAKITEMLRSLGIDHYSDIYDQNDGEEMIVGNVPQELLGVIEKVKGNEKPEPKEERGQAETKRTIKNNW
jgi:hypothetical protein